MASRLETLRTTILAAIEAKRFVSGFVENDFQVSTRWYPVTDYPGLATASGLVLVLGRPSDTEPLVRYGKDAFEEIFRFQIVVLYAATEAVIMLADVAIANGAPIASDTKLGLVKTDGATIDITSAGVISVHGT